MSRNRWPNMKLRAALLGGAMIAVAGCATRRPEPVLSVAPVASQIIWRIEPSDLLKVRVFREPELSSEPVVSEQGGAYFPGVGRLQVAGLTRDSLETLLNARYGAMLREPAVQVTMQREITLTGQVRSPGVFAVDPGSTFLGLIAKAGGQTNPSSDIDLMLSSGGRRLSLPNEARLGTIDIHRADAVMLADRNVFVRNSATIASATVIVTAISTLLSIVILLTR